MNLISANILKLKILSHFPAVIVRKMSSVKPPNILIQESLLKNKISFIKNLKSLVSKERYVLYPISDEDLLKSPWNENCSLLILEYYIDNIEVKEKIITYQSLGGKVLHLGDQNEDLEVTRLSIIDDSDTSLLKKVLETLEIKCEDDVEQAIRYTPGYIVGHSEIVEDFKANVLDKISIFSGASITLDFKESKNLCKEASESYLPINLDGPVPDFDTDLYLSSLETKELGKPLIYVPLITSSQGPLKTLGKHGLVVVPGRQSKGRGRGGNIWLSPQGCGMASVALNLGEVVGGKPSIVQHAVGVTLVQGLSDVLPDDGAHNLKLKWPNDLYWGREVKLGGIICEGSVAAGGRVSIVVGLGLNISNSLPTVCLNAKLKEVSGGEVRWESLLGRWLTRLEQLLSSCEAAGSVEPIVSLYQQHYLHQGERVTLGQEGEQVTIRGVDSFGYLRVEDKEGRIFSVMDDGNSFDMMKGLILPKKRI